MPETFKDKGIALVTAVVNRDAAAIADRLKRGSDIHYSDDLPLRCAAYLGYIDMVKLLLDKGANVHANNNESLFIALQARDIELVNILLEKGASVKAVLDTRKDKLDRGSLDLIGEIESRDARATSEKRRQELKEKAKKFRPNMKMSGP